MDRLVYGSYWFMHPCLVTEAELVRSCDRGAEVYIGKHMTWNQLSSCVKSQRGSVLKNESV